MKSIKVYNKFFAIALTGSLTFVLVGAEATENDTKDSFNNTHSEKTCNNPIGLFSMSEIKEQTTINYSNDETTERIRLSLLNNETTVNIEDIDLSAEEAKQCYLNTLIDNSRTNPCAVWTPSYRIENANKKIDEIIINYDCPIEDLETRLNAYEERVNEIIKLVLKEYNDINKARILQDLLVGSAEYDYDYVEINGQILSSTPATTLLYRKAICSGYARTYADLLRCIDIPAQIIISNDGTHCWNIAYLDGNWYHIDVTYKACLDNLNLFCKSDEYVKKLYPEWTSDIICNNKSYDNGLPFEKPMTKKNKTKLKK